MSGITDFSDITFQYDDKFYQVTERKDNDLTSVFTGWCGNTGSARDLMKSVEKVAQVVGGSCKDVGAYLRATAIPRTPVVIIEAIRKSGDLKTKGFAAVGSYGVAKTFSAICEAISMTGYSLKCFGKLASVPAGNVLRFVGTAQDGLDIGTVAADLRSYGKIYSEMKLNRPEDAAIVKKAINTEWRAAAFKAAKIAIALISGASFICGITIPSMVLGEAALWRFAALEVAMNISSHYTRSLGAYSIKEIKPDVNVA